MLYSNLIERFQNIVIATLILVTYAPNVLTRSDEIATNSINQPNQNSESIVKKGPSEEYFIEHNVSQGDAKRSFHESGIKLIDDKPLPWCLKDDYKCTEQIISYCLSGKLLDDHCCCDYRHGTEEIPWIPHTCYVGKRCEPTTGSCMKYTEIRQCCCDRVLAKRWKSIYSNSITTSMNVFTQLVCVSLLITSWSFY